MGKIHAALFGLMCGGAAGGTQHALDLVEIIRQHDVPMFHAFGMFLEGWAASKLKGGSHGFEDMLGGVDRLRQQGILIFDGLLKMELAKIEVQEGDFDRAIATADEALATSDRTGYRAFEAELHRVRGEMVLKRDPANPAPAEQSLHAALAVARQQGARTFELRSAHSLAKLFRSTGRPVEAHAILAPALDGFASSPEMPEIAAAQALLQGCEGRPIQSARRPSR
jgi:predicted ATPase